MLPSAPLPNGFTCGGQLRQVVRVHLAGFSLCLGTILARWHVVFHHPSADALGNFVGYTAHAIQKHVSITQQDSVVVMVRMAHFPEHLAIPVCLQDHTAFERKSTEEAVFWSAS